MLSTVPWHNISGASQKIQWIQTHFGAEPGSPLWKRVILSHHKHLNRGDYLIDDRPNNGASEFEGEWVKFSTDDYTDWPAVTDYLLAEQKGTK